MNLYQIIEYKRREFGNGDYYNYNKRVALETIGEIYIDSLVIDDFIFESTLCITNEGIGDKLSNLKDSVMSHIKKLGDKIIDWLDKIFSKLSDSKELTNKDEAMALYNKYSSKIKINAPEYDYEPNDLLVKIKGLNDNIKWIVDYIIKSFKNGKDYDPNKCTINSFAGPLITPDGKVNNKVACILAENLIVVSTRFRYRTIKDAIDKQSFQRALDLNTFRNSVKELKSNAKDFFDYTIKMIKKMDNNDMDSSTASRLTSELTKWTNCYARTTTAILNRYIYELNKLKNFMVSTIKVMKKAK